MKKTYMFSFTKKTANAKLGRGMSATYSSSNTCPKACPFLKNGCYASEGFYTRLHWQKIDSGERGITFNELIKKIKALKENSTLRLNVAGDLPGNNNKISPTYLNKYIEATRHIKAYTYTHYPIHIHNNLKLLKQANNSNLVINVSTECENDAIKSVENNLPTVLVVKSTETRNSYKLKDAKGNIKGTVIICPQQTKGVSCSDCMACYNRPKNIVIGFKAHNATKKVNEILEKIKQ